MTQQGIKQLQHARMAANHTPNGELLSWGEPLDGGQAQQQFARFPLS